MTNYYLWVPPYDPSKRGHYEKVSPDLSIRVKRLEVIERKNTIKNKINSARRVQRLLKSYRPLWKGLTVNTILKAWDGK